MNPTATIKADLEREIINSIKSMPQTLERGMGGDTEWTALLKSEMTKIAHRHEYLVCPKLDESNTEWLYDLVWFRNDSNRFLREVALVLESEWARDADEIHYDFEKLLLAKAPIKVMVFQNCRDNLPELWRQLKDGIRIFEQKSNDETYILAAFKEKEHEFEIQVVTNSSHEHH